MVAVVTQDFTEVTQDFTEVTQDFTEVTQDFTEVTQDFTEAYGGNTRKKSNKILLFTCITSIIKYVLVIIGGIMGYDVQLFKPNELVSAFAELELSRTARHLFNYFIQYAQKEIKFNNYQGNTFEININDLNNLAQIHHKNNKIIEKALDNLMRPITIRDADNPRNYEKLVQ